MTRIIRVPHSLGYTKQPEDDLKWAETCCGIYCTYCAKIVLCFDCSVRLSPTGPVGDKRTELQKKRSHNRTI